LVLKTKLLHQDEMTEYLGTALLLSRLLGQIKLKKS